MVVKISHNIIGLKYLLVQVVCMVNTCTLRYVHVCVQLRFIASRYILPLLWQVHSELISAGRYQN